jgi:hypothetical protein
MAKRFTDTDKWKKPWFRELGSKLQLIWIYICDNCDHAGIWDVDLKTVTHHTGLKISLEEVASAFRGKVHVFEQGSKLWVIPFFEFQYGANKESFRARQSALQKLIRLGLVDESGKCLVTLSEELTNSLGIGIGNSIGNKGGAGGIKTPASSFDFEPLWQVYPRKVNKAVGIRRAQQVIKSPEDYRALAVAISNYADRCARDETETRFIKHFATFIEDRDEKPYVQPWREFVNPEQDAQPGQPRKSQLALQAERELAEAQREFGLDGVL